MGTQGAGVKPAIFCCVVIYQLQCVVYLCRLDFKVTEQTKKKVMSVVVILIASLRWVLNLCAYQYVLCISSFTVTLVLLDKREREC